MVDVLYVAHNRLEFTRASFEALVANTNWEHVHLLHVLDDQSEDGTYEWLDEHIGDCPAPARFVGSDFGGPVAAMNHTLDHLATEILAKVDNDLLVCPGWLDQMLAVLDANPGLDVLGTEPGFAEPYRPMRPSERSFLPARHVGGIGLIRSRIFARGKLRPNERFFGWTQFQEQHASCGWITPDLPCFLLDHLPVEPWRSLAAEYVERGWSRPWPAMPETMHTYWDWWIHDREPVA